MSRASWSDDTGRGRGSAQALLRNGSSCSNCHDLQSVCESLNQLLQEKERQVKLLERDLEVQKSLNNKLLENVCEQQVEILKLKGDKTTTTNESYTQMEKYEEPRLEIYEQAVESSNSVKTICIRKHENGYIEAPQDNDASHLEASREAEAAHGESIYATDLESVVSKEHKRNSSTMSDFSMQSVETEHANHVSIHGNSRRASSQSDSLAPRRGQVNGSVQLIETEILHMQQNPEKPPHRPERSTSLGLAGMVQAEYIDEACVTRLNGEMTPRRQVINGEPLANYPPVKKITLVNPIKNLRLNLRHKKQGAGCNGFVPPNLLRDCPVCHMSFPPHNSEIERAHHVNNHFLDN
ncbi:uncharacterized protein LOC133345918 [Lethenteron reissneri]|uniref:uncharacterized protein LOC133345918 n=1 Tax=Lethenteron reissneri TaxID=7753 RepID=UPI002AB63EE8|nr:uncharacterized protein LOC133345918 [Lethenteron reissneri]XP_061413027.1 uncharacterized protein LOC133345918 [Lethenteron reissneri]